MKTPYGYRLEKRGILNKRKANRIKAQYCEGDVFLLLFKQGLGSTADRGNPSVPAKAVWSTLGAYLGGRHGAAEPVSQRDRGLCRSGSTRG